MANSKIKIFLFIYLLFFVFAVAVVFCYLSHAASEQQKPQQLQIMSSLDIMDTFPGSTHHSLYTHVSCNRIENVNGSTVVNRGQCAGLYRKRSIICTLQQFEVVKLLTFYLNMNFGKFSFFI